MVPRYEIVKEEGLAHERVFDVEVRLPDRTSCVASGLSKRMAEEAAAEKYLKTFAGSYLTSKQQGALSPVAKRGALSRPGPKPSRAIIELAEHLRIPPQHHQLLTHACTLPSATHSSGVAPGETNVALAVVGDRLMAAAVKHFLAAWFLQHPDDYKDAGSLALAAAAFISKENLLPIANTCLPFEAIIVGHGVDVRKISNASKIDLLKSIFAAAAISRADSVNLYDILPARLKERLEAIEQQPLTRATLRTPLTQLQELVQGLQLTWDDEIMITGVEHAQEVRAVVRIHSENGEHVEVFGEPATNGKKARQQAAAEAISLLRIAHSDLDFSPEKREIGMRVAQLTIPPAFAYAPQSMRDVALWSSAGLLASQHIGTGNFENFRRWADNAIKFLPIEDLERRALELRAMYFYLQVAPARDEDLLSNAHAIVRGIVQSCNANDALNYSQIRESVEFSRLQELLRVLNIAQKPDTSRSDVSRDIDSLRMLMRDKAISGPIQGYSSISYTEREGSLLELMSAALNWIESAGGGPAFDIATANRTSTTVDISIASVLGSHSDLSQAAANSLLLKFLKCEGFVQNCNCIENGMQFTICTQPDDTFAGRVWRLLLSTLRGIPLETIAVLSRLLHDLKNHLVGADILLSRKTGSRTERLEAHAEASRHFDAVHRIGGAFTALGGAFKAPSLEHVVLRDFFRHYCKRLLERLPSTLVLELPKCTQDAMVFTSGSFLLSILDNLISNSVEAMGAHGQISLEWEVEPEPGDLVITVSDSGPGIDALDLQQLISGGPIRSSKPGGSGIGMLTVVSMLRRLGGQISGTSTLGVGTNWTLRIPSLHPNVSVDTTGT